MRINPRFTDKLVKIGLNCQAFFTVAILVAIVAIIFFKGSPHLNLEFIFSSPVDMGSAWRHFLNNCGYHLSRSFVHLCGYPPGCGNGNFPNRIYKRILVYKNHPFRGRITGWDTIHPVRPFWLHFLRYQARNGLGPHGRCTHHYDHDTSDHNKDE